MDEKCAATETLIQEYLSGCLSDEEKREMFVHLSVCPECRQELMWQNKLKKAADKMLSQPPQELRGLIMEQVEQKKQGIKIIPDGVTYALHALRDSKNTVDRAFIPIRNCLKLASKCI
ncbi:MAG: anti-sigma factor [Eubacteriales bacterium]